VRDCPFAKRADRFTQRLAELAQRIIDSRRDGWRDLARDQPVALYVCAVDESRLVGTMIDQASLSIFIAWPCGCHQRS
jgi:hypothetical protein